MRVRARVARRGLPVQPRDVTAAAPVVVAEMGPARAPLPAPLVVLKPEAPEIVGRRRQVGLETETEPPPARKATEETGVLGAGTEVQGVPGAMHHLRVHRPILGRVASVASVARTPSYPSCCAGLSVPSSPSFPYFLNSKL